MNVPLLEKKSEQIRYHTLNDISKFSPPQTFIPASYSPISKKYSLSIANKPPAIVGDLEIKEMSLKCGDKQHSLPIVIQNGFHEIFVGLQCVIRQTVPFKMKTPIESASY